MLKVKTKFICPCQTNVEALERNLTIWRLYRTTTQSISSIEQMFKSHMKTQCPTCKKKSALEEMFLLGEHSNKFLILQIPLFTIASQPVRMVNHIALGQSSIINVPSTNGTEAFKIRSLLIHEGNTIKSGHWYTMTHNQLCNTWTRISDLYVRQFGKRDHLSDVALIFLERNT
jgi:hypothetical protein